MRTFTLLATLTLALHGCSGSPAPRPKVAPPGPQATKGGGQSGIRPIELPTVEPRSGIAVAILVDTSGSMAQEVKDKGGKSRPKFLIARDALDGIVQQTAKWKKSHPEKSLQLGMFNFNSAVGAIMPLMEFDEARARQAIASMPRPGGGTAIGVAMEEGFKALYGSGAMRKYLVCITDGENTAGPAPERMARQLHEQTRGEVETHFVAFDIAARHFRFLKDVNGHVVHAADGAQLQQELTRIYDQRILAEAEEPAKK